MGLTKIRKKSKAQVSLEVAVIFVLTVGFILGIIRIWIWSQAQMAGRQKAYTGSRLSAGQGSLSWPAYKPKTLTEGWVVPNSPLGNK